MDELRPQNPVSIQEMFGSISGKYDLANSVLSFGIHKLWKKRLVRESGVRNLKTPKILDCATGTGDLAFLFESAAHGNGTVVGSDFCMPMLEVARERARKSGSKVQFEFGDLMRLSYPDGEFDCASISFGIRNVQNLKQGLSELGRVVKSKGRVLVLEFGQPHSVWFSKLFKFYSETLLPRIGGWISGQPKAYRYLQTSSASFPCGDAFLDIAHSTGQYSSGRWISFQWGVAYLYILEKR